MSTGPRGRWGGQGRCALQGSLGSTQHKPQLWLCLGAGLQGWAKHSGRVAQRLRARRELGSGGRWLSQPVSGGGDRTVHCVSRLPAPGRVRRPALVGRQHRSPCVPQATGACSAVPFHLPAWVCPEALPCTGLTGSGAAGCPRTLGVTGGLAPTQPGGPSPSRVGWGPLWRVCTGHHGRGRQLGVGAWPFCRPP